MKQLHNQWRKLWQLSRSDRSLLFWSCILLSIARLSLWLLPFAGLRHLFRWLGALSFLKPANQVSVKQITRAITLAGRLTPGTSKCLARALTAETLFRQYSYPAVLRLGVALGPTGHLEAHAWVELNGEVVIGQLQQLSRFTRLPLVS